jgi:Acetyltransferase (GNAT) family
MRWFDVVAGYFGNARRVLFAAEGAVPAANEAEGYRFVEFEEADLARGGLFRERDRSVWFPRRLREGHRLFGWREGAGAVAGYLWLSTGRQPPVPWVLGLKLRLRDGEAYVWDCRTAEAHRRRQLYAGGLVRLRNIASEQGACGVFIDCDPGNLASIRAIEQSGFVRQGEVRVRRIGSRYLMHNVKAHPRLCGRAVEIAQVLG